MNAEDFKKLIQNERAEIIKPYDLIFKEFIDLGINNMTPEYIQKNVSDLILKLRERSWNDFQPIEKEFTVKILSSLASSDEDIVKEKGLEAVTNFIETYPENIYQLTLSNTNSRRSRAGKEFEAILELLLMACDVSMDSQGNIGKKEFTEKGLGKMVDIVTPTATQFVINKYDTVLISAKTTLRERWQEVSEENNRTSATSMYLATLDDGITSEVIEALDDAGVRLVVPKTMKDNTYNQYGSVISYEQLFKVIISNNAIWDDYDFTDKQKEDIVERFKTQQKKHGDHDFISNYYDKQIERIEESGK